MIKVMLQNYHLIVMPKEVIHIYVLSNLLKVENWGERNLSSKEKSPTVRSSGSIAPSAR